MNPRDYWEAGGKRPEAPKPSRSVRHFLATVILVNACIAVAFGFFYELVRLCLQLGVSPWWSAAVIVAGYVTFVWKTIRPLPVPAKPLQPQASGE